MTSAGSASTETPRPAPVDLRNHHAQCEMNYHLCMALVPGCRTGRSEWAFKLDSEGALQVQVCLVESAPYTTTVDLLPSRSDSEYLPSARLRIRLYHDAEMAEVVAWNHHRNWWPVYNYPNSRMYHPDEKLALNRYLGDWLVHCRKLGIACDLFCESIRIIKK